MSKPMTIDEAERALHEAFPGAAINVRVDLWRMFPDEPRTLRYALWVDQRVGPGIASRDLFDLATGVADFISQHAKPSASDAEASAASASIADLDAELKGEMVTA